MLRGLVLALVLANLLFFIWARGALDGGGAGSSRADREPQRLAQQVRPEAIRLIAPAPESASAIPAIAASAGNGGTSICLEAGPFDDAELATAEATLDAREPGSKEARRWVRVSADRPGIWLVALEGSADSEADLSRLDVVVEEVRAASAAEPSRSIGRYDSRPAAEAALAMFGARGLRGGRVLELQPAATVHRLRIADATPAEVTAFQALSDGLLGKGFSRCKGG